MRQLYRIPCIDRYGEVIMSLLAQKVTLQGVKGETSVVALFDSGASYSCLRKDIAEKIGHLEPLDACYTHSGSRTFSRGIAQSI